MSRYGGIQERLQRLGRRNELQIERDRIGQSECLNNRDKQLVIKIRHRSFSTWGNIFVPTYMRLDGLDVRADLWSYGACYLEPLFGRRLDGGKEGKRRRNNRLWWSRARLIDKLDLQPVIG